MSWSQYAANDARHLRRAATAAKDAVRTLKAMGHDDAWNLWLDVCDEASPEVGRRKRRDKNPDGSARKSRALPPTAGEETTMSETTTSENGTPDAPKKKGRPKGSAKTKAPAREVSRRGWDLVLSKGKTARLEIPSELSAEDLEAMKLQIDAIHKLLEVQEGIRAEAG